MYAAVSHHSIQWQLAVMVLYVTGSLGSVQGLDGNDRCAYLICECLVTMLLSLRIQVHNQQKRNLLRSLSSKLAFNNNTIKQPRQAAPESMTR
jgi:hypothetical protein